FEHRACRPDEPVLVRIVDLTLVIVSDNEFVVPPLSRFPIDMRPDQPTLGKKMIDWSWIKDCIRQSNVTDRIREQAADPQLLARRGGARPGRRRVRRPADVGDCS